MSAALGAFWAPAMAMLSDAADHARVQQGFAFALVNLAWATGQVAGTGAGGALADARATPSRSALRRGPVRRDAGVPARAGHTGESTDRRGLVGVWTHRCATTRWTTSLTGCGPSSSARRQTRVGRPRCPPTSTCATSSSRRRGARRSDPRRAGPAGRGAVLRARPARAAAGRPPVDEIMVNGPGPSGSSGRGAWRPAGARSPTEAELRACDRADPRAAGPARRRGRAALRRPAARRFTGQRRDRRRWRSTARRSPSAASAARASTPTSSSRAGPGTPPLRDLLRAAVARPPATSWSAAARVGQDDDAQRAVVVRRRRRADRDDRGHRGAAPAAAARRPPRGAAAERRGRAAR